MARRATKAASIDRRAQAREVIKRLNRLYPDAECALHHRNAYELIVATILSAQCTDARVNMVTPTLFAQYPDADALAAANPADVESTIRSTGFFRAKTRSLIGMARGLVEHHGGEVPEDLDALTELPGVGRKTAHVVLGTAFAHPSGVVVDTHVKRLAYRLGLTDSTDPAQIERELTAIVPRKEWINFSHRLIHHGRQLCIARKPRCGDCLLLEICPQGGVTAVAGKSGG